MYEAIEVLDTEQACIHRMREISDSLLRLHSDKEVSFTTCENNNRFWELRYVIDDKS